MRRSSALDKAVVYNVGRRGEVAGGMTQVVNSYAAWTFDEFKVRVIESRDGSRGLRALAIFSGAVASIVTLKRSNSPLVVVHLSQGGSFIREGILLRLAKSRRLATVAQLHGSSFAQFAQRKPQLVLKVLASADVVHVLSEETRDAVSLLLPGAQIELLANAVMPGKPTEKERVVVFGGAVTRRKGVDTLLAAWHQVGPTFPDWSLMLAGPHVEPELLNDLPNNVEVLGAIPHANLMRLLEKSAVAVLPSLDEAMPMFILEAMARHNCVIATPVGAVGTLLENGNGLLVEPGSVVDLANALQISLGDAVLRSDIAANGNELFAKTYSSEVVMPALERLWALALTSNQSKQAV